MSLVLQDRDHVVREALARAVRLLTLLQVAALRGADISNTRKRMARLEAAGHVEKISIWAQVPPDVSKPLCVWHPGDPLLNPYAISYAAKKRYRTPPRRMMAYIASRKTLNHFCVVAKPIKSHQATHDIGLSQVFSQSPWPRKNWVGEDLFPDREPGKKVEDVLLCKDGDLEQPYMAIDYICKYSAERVAALSRDLADRELPFCFY